MSRLHQQHPLLAHRTATPGRHAYPPCALAPATRGVAGFTAAAQTSQLSCISTSTTHRSPMSPRREHASRSSRACGRPNAAPREGECGARWQSRRRLGEGCRSGVHSFPLASRRRRPPTAATPHACASLSPPTISTRAAPRRAQPAQHCRRSLVAGQLEVVDIEVVEIVPLARRSAGEGLFDTLPYPRRGCNCVSLIR